MATSQPPADDLFSKLETPVCNIDDIKAQIHERLNQAKDASFLNSLVDYYMNNGYNRCQEVLVGICEPHDKHLFDKLNDCLKGSARQRTLTLLSHIAHKQPSWIHKISQHSLFPSVLKVLKTDNDVSNLVTGVLLIVTLFHIIPHTIGHHHINDMCEIFTRLSTIYTKKQDVPDVIMMHLHVAIYALFHRLYSLFPCNFLNYLRNYCISSREHPHVFNETIRPMLDHVRMHPMLVTYTKDAEISVVRWKYKETHDIVVDCARLSLDVAEGTREDVLCPDRLSTTLSQFNQAIAGVDFLHHGNQSFTASSTVQSKASTPGIRESILEHAVLDVDAFSPAASCSLFTPPPQLEGMGVSTEQTTFVSPELLASGRIQGSKKESKELLSTDKTRESAAITKIPTHPESSSKDALKLHRSESLSKTEGVSQSKVLIPLIKSSSATTYASLHQQSDEQVEAKTEKQDATDVEVESIFEHRGVGSETSAGVTLRTTPVAEGSRSGRGSGQWCQSPCYDYLNEAQRGRSYSQGKRMPRRATIDSTRRGSIVSRSNSMPNIAQLEQPIEMLDLLNQEKVEYIRANSFSQTSERRQLLPTSHLLYAALPQNLQLASTNKSAGAGVAPSQRYLSSFLQLSPPEILDRYLLKCEKVFSVKVNQPSANVQIQRSVKHGTSDEINILQNQLQLLHAQLMYERNKREIHAERNRRLLGKAKHSKVLEEQNYAIKDQMKLLEKEIAAVNASITKLRRNNLINLETKEQEIQKLKAEVRSNVLEKVNLTKRVADLVSEVSVSKLEAVDLKKHVDKVESDLFNCLHELQTIQTEVGLNSKLKEEIVKLTRELLLMTELNKKYSDNITSLQTNFNYESELSSLHDTYDKEISFLRVSLETRDAQFESTKCRNLELEGLLLKKDKIIAEQKKLFNYCKEEYDLQLKAVEEKYKSRGTLCQMLEAEILFLLQKLDKQTLENMAAEEAGGAVGGKCDPIR
ncbi:hamartin, variant 2 [Chamberlinius hualienensis]